jgi:LytS/YehU family sensor histidine kinase
VVENAIIHGIDPLAEGGEINIDISKDNEWLSITVSDNGRGLEADAIKGFGLGNIRDRLHSIFGNDARLRIEENTPRGVKVIIEVPYVKA